MEYTKYLRKFLNLLRYDKPHNSLPICLLLFLTVMGLITISIAALEQKDVDISLEAIKDVVSIIIVFICIIEQSIFPERTLKLIRLIEDEFIVNRDQLVERKYELWLEVGLLYERKRQDMRSKFQCLNWALFLIFCGYFSKHFLNQMVGIEAQSEENGQKRWPTPFLYPIPQTYSSSYLFYTYTIHIIMLASACYEGYLILISVSLSTEKVLADFETMYMLIDHVTKDFPDSRSNSHRQLLVHRQNEEKNIRKSDANLRADMAQLVRCHQIICRNFKICKDCSSLVITATIATIVNDSCSNAFFMLKNNDVKKAVSFTFMFITENLIMFFLCQNGQRIFNQNDVLRKYLAKLPWTNKPRWFRQTVHIMMTRANVDTEMKPFGIFVLNYVSFKDIMKFTFSVGNVLYTKKLRSQAQQNR